MKTKKCIISTCRGDAYGWQDVCYSHYVTIRNNKKKAITRAKRLQRLGIGIE